MTKHRMRDTAILVAVIIGSLTVVSGSQVQANQGAAPAGSFVVQWKSSVADLDGDGLLDLIVAHVHKKESGVTLVGTVFPDHGNQEMRSVGLQRMNKTELIEAIARAAGISKSEATRTLDAFVRSADTSRPHDGRNAQRGKEIKIASKKISLMLRTVERIQRTLERCDADVCSIVAEHADVRYTELLKAKKAFAQGNELDVVHSLRRIREIVETDLSLLRAVEPRGSVAAVLGQERALWSQVTSALRDIAVEEEGAPRRLKKDRT